MLDKIKTGRKVRLSLLAEVCSGSSNYVMKKPPFLVKEFVRQRVAEEQLLKWLVNNGIVNPYRGALLLAMIDIKKFGLTDEVEPKINITNGKATGISFELKKEGNNGASKEHADSGH